ncbi:hypothetical protein ON010_g14522 [Phytophthora cinnamomi]|nr:hypothetical protein ON010_g14522 [Phytophthora cinnamomi]
MQSLAAALTQNKSLEELTLGQNKGGSAGVRHLASAFATGHVALSTLELGKNGVDQEGAIALARSLCGTNRLQNLYLDHNPLGDVGASAFGALLAQNAELRVLDLSYTHMSLLGLRELSVVGLARSRALLCLLVDGHDWASTQYMKKNQHPSLNGASLATKGANNYAASCIVGAINANVHSVLFKLTGVDLSLVVAVPAPSSSTEGRRESDTLTRNELVLKGLHDARVAAQATASGIPPSHKRKPTEDAGNAAADRSTTSGADSGADSDAGESSSPVVQHPKFQKLEGNLKAGSSSGSISSANGGGSGGSGSGSANALLGLLPPPHNGPGNGASSSAGGSGGSSPSKTSTNRPPRVIRIPSRGSMGRFPRSGGSCEKRLSLKSPRYESTMEVHVRKVISDIAKLPFNADEFDTLQAYYLGGRCSAGSSGCGDWGVDDVTGEPTPCPACRSSRLAQYRRTMVSLRCTVTTRHCLRASITDCALFAAIAGTQDATGSRQASDGRGAAGAAAPAALPRWRVPERGKRRADHRRYPRRAAAALAEGGQPAHPVERAVEGPAHTTQAAMPEGIGDLFGSNAANDSASAQLARAHGIVDVDERPSFNDSRLYCKSSSYHR